MKESYIQVTEVWQTKMFDHGCWCCSNKAKFMKGLILPDKTVYDLIYYCKEHFPFSFERWSDFKNYMRQSSE